MESTFAVIVLFLCMSYEIGAKTNTAGYTSSNRLDGEFNELTANELSIQIDNCHEACLQKVRFDYEKKNYKNLLKMVWVFVFVLLFFFKKWWLIML